MTLTHPEYFVRGPESFSLSKERLRNLNGYSCELTLSYFLQGNGKKREYIQVYM